MVDYLLPDALASVLSVARVAMVPGMVATVPIPSHTTHAQLPAWHAAVDTAARMVGLAMADGQLRPDGDGMLPELVAFLDHAATVPTGPAWATVATLTAKDGRELSGSHVASRSVAMVQACYTLSRSTFYPTGMVGYWVALQWSLCCAECNGAGTVAVARSRVGKRKRCPVCLGVAVVDSPSVAYGIDRMFHGAAIEGATR